MQPKLTLLIIILVLVGQDPAQIASAIDGINQLLELVLLLKATESQGNRRDDNDQR